MRNAFLLLALLPGLLACAGAPTEPTFYLLRPADSLQSRELVPSNDFALGKITIAPYLDQAGMLLETTAGEIRPARQHLWAEPLYEGIHTYLVIELSRAKGEDILPARLEPQATLVEVRIDQLHGTANGKAVLTAYWWFRRDGEVLAAHQFSETRQLDRDGYAALAEAERELLSTLAGRIASSMEATAQAGDS